MAYDTSHVHVVILCGGSGTRLWPLSRKNRPKQFLNLDGSSRSLLQKTLDRLKNIAPPERRWLVTTAGQEQLARQQCEDQVGHMLVEPRMRNTAASVALSAHTLLQKDPESYMVILSADHSIQNVRSFEKSLWDALELASHNHFVTLGVQPNYPATGFGYIECGPLLEQFGNLGYSVRSFQEKPHAAAALQFLRTGKYLWNAGIFVWKTSEFWAAFSHIQPKMAQALATATAENLADVYGTLPSLPIDVAFMEQTAHLACVPASFDWNDVGSWASVGDSFQRDAHGNSVVGQVFMSDSKNMVIHSSGPFVCALGLKDIVVVATEDAILVTHVDAVQDVKKVIAHLETLKRTDLL